MSSVWAHTLALAPHPAAAAPASFAIETRVSRQAEVLTLAYTLAGDLAQVRLPSPCPGHRGEGLWRHTCFEAFVAPDPGPAYLELNFSPSGEWASLAFTGYREGGAADDSAVPAMTVARGERRVAVDASLSLPQLAGGAPARLALAAVVEAPDGGLTYWALAHPAGRPDFHHPSAFTLRI
ncbi:MAG: DOMON-like domain-containing protein [Steroidobacteraceae bacterium]